MSSADEIALVDTVSRADLGTLATRDTNIVVDRCEVVNNLYRVRRTVLFTLAAGNTTVEAHLANGGTLLVI